MKIERATAVACLILGSLALSARPADAQIAKIVDNSGRSFFVNSNTASVKLAPASKAHTNIYLPGEISFTGLAHPAVDMDRDGVEKLVREAAGRHRLDPAVDRAHGVPSFRETRDYVQKVQNAYFRPGSGRLPDAFVNTHAIHRDVTPEGRIIFRND